MRESRDVKKYLRCCVSPMAMHGGGFVFILGDTRARAQHAGEKNGLR